MTDQVYDVVIVGGGPAGMAAAAAAAQRRPHSVAVVDSAGSPGGQYWRQPSTRPAVSHREVAADPQFDTFVQAHRSNGVTYLLGRQAWTCSQVGNGFVVHTVTTGSEEHPETLRCRRLVLATGAHDRQIPFRGWDLPGVVAAGGAQALLKTSGTLVGRRVAVAGTGPFLLPVATGLAAAGATVVGIFEHAHLRAWTRHPLRAARVPGKTWEAAAYAARLLRHGIPYRTGHRLVAAVGEQRLQGVTFSRSDGTKMRELAVDALAVGWGFNPLLELPRALGCALVYDAGGSRVCAVDENQQTSVPGVYAAGEISGVGGSDLAILEGTLAGIAATADAGDSSGLRRLRRRIDRHRAFAAAMHAAHPLPSVDQWSVGPDTIVCRCEEVTCEELLDCVSEHEVRGSRAAKLITRAGLGWCQGRVCGTATDRLTGTGADAVAQPATPSPIAFPPLLGSVASTEVPLPRSAELRS